MEIDSSQRLALRLHALHASDRDWILSQIDPEARTRLEPMLQELDSLGFRIDREILDSVEGRSDFPESDPATLTYRQHIERLSKSSPEWLLKHLKTEPQAIIDCVVATYPWPWLAALQASDALDKGSLRNAEPRLGPTTRVRQALLGELVRLLETEHPDLERAAPAMAGHRTEAPTDSVTTLCRRRWWPWKR